MMLHMSDPAHWFTPLTSRRHLQAYEPTLRMIEDERSYKPSLGWLPTASLSP